MGNLQRNIRKTFSEMKTWVAKTKSNMTKWVNWQRSDNVNWYCYGLLNDNDEPALFLTIRLQTFIILTNFKCLLKKKMY